MSILENRFRVRREQPIEGGMPRPEQHLRLPDVDVRVREHPGVRSLPQGKKV